MRRITLVLLCSIVQFANAIAQNYSISNIGGTGNMPYNGDGIAATSANLQYPMGLATDNKGNLYVADMGNNRIRKIDANGTITTVAGTGTPGFSGDGGLANKAQLNRPFGLTIDAHGNLYITDCSNFRIRKIDTNGIITTIAGNGTYPYKGDGSMATNTGLSPTYLSVDAEGNIYVSDDSNYRVLKISTSGTISTILGNGVAGFSGDNGPGINAEVYIPSGIAIDRIGYIYIADARANSIRKLDKNGIVTTIAGTGTEAYSGDGGPASSATFSSPNGIAIDSSGNIYITDTGNNRIRFIDMKSGIISTIAGNGRKGINAETEHAISAMLDFPAGITLAQRGNLYFTDDNNLVRKLHSKSGVRIRVKN